MDGKRIVFYSYIRMSKTLERFKEVFENCIVVKHVSKKYRPIDNDVIIFWGSGRVPSWYNEAVNNDNIITINNPVSISKAGNKLIAFKILKNNDIPIPEFTENVCDLENFSTPFLARTRLRGHSGVGIEIVHSLSDIPTAKVYVEYINKEKEYRVHIFDGKAIKYSRKIPRSSVDNHDEYVWSHDNGYYFNRVRKNTKAEEIAIMAIQALGLDFGAVDIVKKDKKYYVLEINTAPGLQNQSIDVYQEAIKNFIIGGNTDENELQLNESNKEPEEYQQK